MKTHHPFIKVIVLTSRGEKARDFLKEEGADDFFAKDDWEEWAQGKLVLAMEECIGYLVCRSSAMQRVREQLEAIGENEQFVLLEGEPGSGKRYLAQVIHRCSPRAHLRLELLDCSALNEDDLLVTLLGRQGGGVLGNRETGAVVLPRVEALSPQSQQRLAAVLESLCGAAASPRIALTVAGGGRELHAAGKIELELYALFAPEWGAIGKAVHLPPLRERREDLPDLVAHFCHHYSRLHRKTVTHVHPHALANKIG